jgi:hypothetical protein
LQRKQGWEKTLRQIQGNNLLVKTSMKENFKTNPGRQTYRENKHERKPKLKFRKTTLHRKQGRETTLNYQVTPGFCRLAGF